MTGFRTGEQTFQNKQRTFRCAIKKEGSQKLMNTSEKGTEAKKKKGTFTNQTKSEM